MAPSASKTSIARKKAIVYITGESPLVEEYAALGSAHGYDVVVQWNEDRKRDKEYRRSAIVPAGTSIALELTNTDLERKKRNLQKLDKALPPTAAIISSSVTVSASEQATWIIHRHRLAGCCALPSFSAGTVIEVAPTVYTPVETMEVVRRFFTSLGKHCEFVEDRVGMVLPRVVCQIINEACFALQEGVSTPAELDTAMKLGVNYPRGPIEWAEAIGIRQVEAVLRALERDLGEDRYRVAPLLHQMALTGEWWNRNPREGS
ncbi:MAG: 3-hydroxybutyryl-CoA dehydrogenase [Ignavibacterium sp.]|jgi:3-hydroxybutyryl-CoA dehydrogenase